jgi:hypothetical protein
VIRTTSSSASRDLANERRSTTSSRPRSPMTVADLVDALQADEAGGSAPRSSPSTGTGRRARPALALVARCAVAAARGPCSARSPWHQTVRVTGSAGIWSAAIDAAEGLAPCSCSSKAHRATTRDWFVPGGPLGFIRPSVRSPRPRSRPMRLPGMGAVDDRAARVFGSLLALRRGRPARLIGRRYPFRAGTGSAVRSGRRTGAHPRGPGAGGSPTTCRSATSSGSDPLELVTGRRPCRGRRAAGRR